jgi:DNA-binding transcriptional LysR family regulator
VNHRHIEVFSLVMKSGSLSRAAELLGITQPAVSRTIADLEKEVGFSLFDRVRNRIVPTPEGKQFSIDVEESFTGLDALRVAASRIRDQGAGQISIGCLSQLSFGLLPKAVRQFKQKHPEILVMAMILPSRDIRNGVASGQFDIGLAADEIDVSGLVHQQFISCPCVCAMPPGHPLEAKDVITPRDLHDQPFIAYVPEDRARQRADEIFAEAGAVPKVMVETLYASTACALVAEGVGLALVSTYSASGFDPARIALRPFEPTVLAKTLLILPPDRPKSLLVRDFIDALMVAR